MFKIVHPYPDIEDFEPEDDVFDIDDAWYEWKPSGESFGIQIDNYFLPIAGNVYTGLLRFDVLDIMESLKYKKETSSQTRKIADKQGIPIKGNMHKIIFGDYMVEIPIVLFDDEGDNVNVYTRTLLEENPPQWGILPQRDLVDPVKVSKKEIIYQFLSFAEDAMDFYVRMFPAIKEGEMFLDWVDRIKRIKVKQ